MPPVSQGFSSAHPGVDYSVKCGTPLGAPFDGRIIARIPLPTSYGTHIWIRSSAKPGLYALIAHMQFGSPVHAVGQQVVAGEYIGRSGNTGHVASGGKHYLRGGPPGVGCHVHFGVKRGGTPTPNGVVGGVWIEPSASVGKMFSPRPASIKTDTGQATNVSWKDWLPGGQKPDPFHTKDLRELFSFTIPQYLKIGAGGFVGLIAVLVLVAVTALESRATKAATNLMPGPAKSLIEKRSSARKSILAEQSARERGEVRTQIAEERAFRVSRARAKGELTAYE